MSVRLRLRKTKRDEEARKCLDDLGDFNTRCGFDQHSENLAGFDKQWRMTIKRHNPPWDHASNFNPPITFKTVEDMHAIIAGFFQSLNFFSMAPSSLQDIAENIMRKRANMFESYVKWSMENQSNVISYFDKWVHDGCLFGTAVGYLPWVKLIRNMRTEFYLPDEAKQADNITDRTLIQIALGPRLKRVRHAYPMTATGSRSSTMMVRRKTPAPCSTGTTRTNPRVSRSFSSSAM